MKESKSRVELREVHVFERDLPYMKADIWAEGKAEDRDSKANEEIYRVFAHDPATYPNQDNAQHYPTVQFAGNASNNTNHVLQDRQASRTEINNALRNVVENAKGSFARDGDYSREALWDKVEIAKEGVQRTTRGLRQDLSEIQSRDGGKEFGKPAKFEFESNTGYLQTDIFGESKPAEPKKLEPQPEPPKTAEPKKPECSENQCEPGTLGHALANADSAEKQVDNAIAPVAPAEPVVPVTETSAEA